jgi:hypothetical protein
MRTFILTTLIVISFSSSGQTKNGLFAINIGFNQTDTYSKLFYNRQNDEPIYPAKQFSATFLDVNLLYSKQTRNPKLRIVFGIGLNQKGFGENGMQSDGSANTYFYVSKLKKEYFSLYGGISYDLIVNKKTKLTVGQLLNPEIDLNNTELYKKMPLSTRTNLTFAWKVGNNFSLQLTPYFQTALSKYNRSLLTNNSSNYIPYGFGLNVGLAFAK